MSAREVRHLRERDARLVPWKNGRGITRELALGPDGSSFERADFDWRISVARIEEAGPFSPFPGFERILVITEGEGVVLEHGKLAPRARLRRLDPYRFSGDWPTHCELPRGPVADFNVLARRGKFSAEVLAVPLGPRQLREAVGATQTLVHVLGGPLIARVSGEEEPFELQAGESLWLGALTPHDEIDLVGRNERSTVVVARLKSLH
ncbi:MAG TPA: HutD family protein [Planctomycetota bacterium]|nr:HutD family protein [Planctomycetota bacterium]